MVAHPTSIPGPRSLPLVGSPWLLGKDPLESLPALVREFGDLVTFTIAKQRVYVLAHPDDIETVLLAHAKHTIKDAVTQELTKVLGTGLLTSEGAFWKSQRRSIAPAFQPRSLHEYADAMVQTAHEHVDSLPGGSHSIQSLMANCTLDILVRTVFGEEPGGLASSVGGLVHDMMSAFITERRTHWRFMPAWIPAAHRRAVHTANHDLDQIIHTIVTRARARPSGTDLLSALIAARDDEGRGMSDQELRNELVTLLLAGHETTAIALSMATWLLAEHPEVQTRAHQEVSDVLQAERPTLDDVKRLPFLAAVVRETLRLYPPAWAMARESHTPLDIRGRVLEPGAQIVLSPWITHRDPRFWIGPTRFRPDRWLNDETENLPRMAYFPYGGGRRVCVGQHFAHMEMVLVLAVLLQRHSIQAKPGFAPALTPAVTLRPTHGIQVVLHPRTR